MEIGGYKINVPNSFNLVSFALAGPPEQHEKLMYAPTLVLAYEAIPPEINLQQYVLALTDQLRRAPTPARRGNKLPKQVTMTSGFPAVIINQTMADPAGNSIEQLLLVTMRGQIAYVLTASCPAGEPFAKHQDMLEQALLSFTIAGEK